MNTLRCSAAACQMDLPNPTKRAKIDELVTQMNGMVRMLEEYVYGNSQWRQGCQE